MKSLIPYLFCVILGAVLVLWFRGCKDAPCSGTEGKVISTSVKSDSIIKTIPAETSAWHKPQPVDSIVGLEGGDIEKAIKTGQYRESLVHTKPTPAELSDTPMVYAVPSIADDYLDSYDYDEDYHFNNGDVHVETHISANKIDSQRVILSNVKEKIITNTVTVTKEVQALKRNEMYLGISSMGNMAYPFYAFGPSLSFKTKTDRVIEAGVLYTRDKSLMYQLGLKFKITFRKQ